MGDVGTRLRLPASLACGAAQDTPNSPTRGRDEMSEM